MKSTSPLRQNRLRPTRSAKGAEAKSQRAPLREFVEILPPGAAIDSFEDKKLRFTRRVIFLARCWRNLLDVALRVNGDSHARWLALSWVNLLDGKANHRELAERVGVELPTLVRLLNRLEKERLVKRQSLGSKGRAKAVVLTTPGRENLVAMNRVVESTRATFLGGLDEAKMTAALETLDVLLVQYATVLDWRRDPRGR